MAETVPLAIYKQSTNGQTSYSIIPDYGTVFGASKVSTPEETQQAISWFQKMASDPTVYNANEYKTSLDRYLSGVSPYTKDASGQLTTTAAVDEQTRNAQLEQQGILKNVGTATAPLYVPTGSPGDLLKTNPTQYNALYSGYGGVVSPVPTAPTTTQQTNIYAKAANYTGPSIVDFLAAAGQPYDHNSLVNLAKQYGITNYAGTASQNTQLLNTLKGIASGQVSPLGVPGSFSTPAPTANTPINASSLGSGIGDLSKLLGANVSGLNVGSDIAGLLSLYGASSESQKKYDELGAKLTEIMGSLGNEGADLQKAMDEAGVGAAYQQVKELNLKAAQLKGELDKFDAESQQGSADLEGQSIPTGLIVGQQAQYQKQRDLTRMAKAAELSATVALSQAYQGNAQLGMELAQKAVDLKYAPILNQIDVLKTQLSLAGDKLSKDDAARSKVIDSLLNLKLNDINQQKAAQSQIQSMAIQAALNGAPLSVTNAIMNATDPVTAANLGSKYLKGSLESISGSGTGSSGTGTGAKIFTQTQINNGAANAGISLDAFSKLSNDGKNYFINGYTTFNSILKKVQSGDEDASAFIDEINASNIPDEIKPILIDKVKPYVQQSSGGGGFFGAVGNFLGGAWSGLMGLFQ